MSRPENPFLFGSHRLLEGRAEESLAQRPDNRSKLMIFGVSHCVKQDLPRKAGFAMKKRPPKTGSRVIFVKWFRHPKTGRIIYASQYGKKAFPIEID